MLRLLEAEQMQHVALRVNILVPQNIAPAMVEVKIAKYPSQQVFGKFFEHSKTHIDVLECWFVSAIC